MKIYFLIFVLALGACAGGDGARTPREKFIQDHYADLMVARKQVTPQAMSEMPIDEQFKYFNTLRKIGIYDVDESDGIKMVENYLEKVNAAKKKRIAEIEKSKHKYEHSGESMDRLIVQCAVVATEIRLPGVVEVDGDEFFNNDSKLRLLLAANDYLCACAAAKFAPRFSPQVLDDYVTYVKTSQMIMAKNGTYNELSGKKQSEADTRLLFSMMAKNYNALDDDDARVMDANVLSYFLMMEDKECLDGLNKALGAVANKK